MKNLTLIYGPKGSGKSTIAELEMDKRWRLEAHNEDDANEKIEAFLADADAETCTIVCNDCSYAPSESLPESILNHPDLVIYEVETRRIPAVE